MLAFPLPRGTHLPYTSGACLSSACCSPQLVLWPRSAAAQTPGERWHTPEWAVLKKPSRYTAVVHTVAGVQLTHFGVRMPTDDDLNRAGAALAQNVVDVVQPHVVNRGVVDLDDLIPAPEEGVPMETKGKRADCFYPQFTTHSPIQSTVRAKLTGGEGSDLRRPSMCATDPGDSVWM